MPGADTRSRQAPNLDGLAPIMPLSVHQYHQMIAAGIIPEGAPVELIEGYLVPKDRGRGPGMPHGEPHACSITYLADSLVPALAPRWVVRVQLPINLGDLEAAGNGSSPEPDVAVVRGPRKRYKDHHPGPRETRLAVEVSDTTLAYDRNVKGRLYAAAGISVYWIVNIPNRQLEVYTRPNTLACRYLSHKVFGEGESVHLRLPRTEVLTFRVRDFLP